MGYLKLLVLSFLFTLALNTLTHDEAISICND